MFENTDYRTDGEKTAEGWVVILGAFMALPALPFLLLIYPFGVLFNKALRIFD